MSSRKGSKGRGASRRRYGLRASDTGMPLSLEPKDFGETTSITATTPIKEQKAENKPGGRKPRETWVQRALREERERRERFNGPEGQ